MPSELEIKIRLSSDNQFESTVVLCQNFCSVSGVRMVQLDEYFDTPDEQLKEQDLTLRLRSIDGDVKVALKSPRVHLASGMTDRIELEFSAASETEVREQLKHQGLKVAAAIEKHRWTFASGGIEIAIDKLPFIGAFLEVEGPDEHTINETLKSLQLSSYEAVRQNYTELLEAKLAEIGLPLRPNLRATFEVESRWRQEKNL